MNAAETDRTYRSSTPAWPASLAPPEGAPNILYVVLDDVGFAQLGCYASEISAPSMDRLAAGGLLYTNFHTTALCSPGRAWLLTGRNAHAVGVGMVPETASGFMEHTDDPQIGRLTGFLEEIGALELTPIATGPLVSILEHGIG